MTSMLKDGALWMHQRQRDLLWSWWLPAVATRLRSRSLFSSFSSRIDHCSSGYRAWKKFCLVCGKCQRRRFLSGSGTLTKVFLPFRMHQPLMETFSLDIPTTCSVMETFGKRNSCLAQTRMKVRAFVDIDQLKLQILESGAWNKALQKMRELKLHLIGRENRSDSNLRA